MFTKNNSFAARIFKMILVFAVAMASIVPTQVHAMPQAVINTPGTLDITFDSDGLVSTAFGVDHSEGWSVAIQPDGKIVVAGYSRTTEGTSDFALVRYDVNGSLDPTFDTDGKVTTDFGFGYSNEYATEVAIQSDGKIVVVGHNVYPVAVLIARYNSDGSLDTNFDGDGKVITEFRRGLAVAIQVDGKIIIAGNKLVETTNYEIAVERYNSDGSLDTTFDTDGFVTTDVGTSYDYASSVLVQPDGRILVGGFTSDGTNTDFLVIRYNSDGSLDTSFSTDGIVTTDFSADDDYDRTLALQSDGKIVQAGFSDLTGYLSLARYNNNGSLDTSFDTDGKTRTYFGYDVSIEDVAIQANQKIITAGSSCNAGPCDFLLVRYNSNGSLDNTFDSDGQTTTDFGDNNQQDSAMALALQSDGNIVVAGYRSTTGLDSDFAVARYIGDVSTQTRYVDADAGGDHNGTSWANAYTDLQSAIAAASSGDEIWVAAGTYKPTANKDRSISFALKNGVKIYGGFAGTETSLAQRNPTTNVTILSGDIGIQADNSDNSYHVLVGSSTNNSAILDGFTVTDGNANGEMYPSYQADGGGMFSFIGSPSLANVIFSENSALFAGGGMYNLGDSFNYPNGSSPILTNVVFSGNSATEGGGMRNENYSNPILTNVAFSNNTAERSGGGMENFYHSSPTLINITFSGNTSAGGGAIMNWSSSSPSLTNVTFNANSATDEGGGIYNDSGSNPSLNNVTFSGNTANQGGGLYNASGSNPVTVNSIFYGNSGGQIYDESGTKPVTYSIIQGGYAGIGNLDADPLLGSLADNGGFTKTMALDAGSPAINAGTNTDCPATDQRGVSRLGGQCDIGAYEYRLDATFEDVPWDHWAWSYIEALYNAGVTSGCSLSPLMFCPSTTVTRDQMAVFLLKAKYGSGHVPPTPTGVFQDVPTDYWAAPWIEELAAEGITSGCSVSPKLYCPTTTVTRDQMAVFLLKAEHGSGYTPPTPTGVFEDVTTDYWAASWIERLSAEGITGGCSVTPKLYCPATPVSRDQMAIFLDKTFGIPLP